MINFTLLRPSRLQILNMTWKNCWIFPLILMQKERERNDPFLFRSFSIKIRWKIPKVPQNISNMCILLGLSNESESYVQSKLNLTNVNLLFWKLLIAKVRTAARGLEKERKKERKKERRSSLQKRNEAGTDASILAKKRGRNVFLKMRNGQCFATLHTIV